jgi:hypothetical protein
MWVTDIIKSLVESYGLFISSNKVPGGICAVSCLEYIHQKFGFHVLDRTLRLCVGTWEGDYNSLSANMLKGIAQLIVAFGNVVISHFDLDYNTIFYRFKLDYLNVKKSLPVNNLLVGIFKFM